MSRFLDAMRDRGKQASDDIKEGHSYKGQIVDVDDVLGVTENSDVTEPTPDILPELSLQPPEEEHALDKRTVVQSRETSSGRSPPESMAHVVEVDNIAPAPEPVYSATKTQTPLKKTELSDTDYPREKQPLLNMRSLDPLFYLIIGVAALGLFGSLYALITQNDAYFEREFQQLQRESAALDARLAASERLSQTDLSQKKDEPTSSVEKLPTTGIPPVSVNEAALLTAQAIEVVDTDSLSPGATVATATLEAVTLAAEIVSPGSSAETTSAEIALPPDDGPFETLKQEVQNLRQTLLLQEEKIASLEREKDAMSTQREPGNRAQASDQSVEKNIASDPPAALSSVPVSSVESGLQISMQPNPARPDKGNVGALITQGYLAYQAADYATAAELYSRALQFDPYSRDANLGVAAVAQHNGDMTLAEDRYRHLLTLEPTDALVFSALLNMASGNRNGSMIEFELSQHAEYVGDSPILYSILGNYYSQQQRWLEAERAYAVAIIGDDRNGDYLFNYAVVLDNLGHLTEASNYYSLALDAATGGSRLFDEQAVRRRLESIRESLH